MKEEPIEEQQPISSRPLNRWLLIVMLLLFSATAFSFVYVARARRYARQLASSHNEMSVALSQMRSQLEAVTAKVNALNALPTAEPVWPPPRPSEARARQGLATRSTVKSRKAEDPRWKQIQAELAEHQKQIAATQQDIQKTRADLEGNLKSTRHDLSGSIARTHEELVTLQKRGERNYCEFDLEKSKLFHRVGPISVSLRKAHHKRQYCDLEMLVDDIQLSKKHVNLYEPVLFYPQGYAQPLELVINQIDKDQARGYVSEPKYKPSALAVGAAPGSESSSPSNAAANLPHRP